MNAAMSDPLRASGEICRKQVRMHSRRYFYWSVPGAAGVLGFGFGNEADWTPWITTPLMWLGVLFLLQAGKQMGSRSWWSRLERVRRNADEAVTYVRRV